MYDAHLNESVFVPRRSKLHISPRSITVCLIFLDFFIVVFASIAARTVYSGVETISFDDAAVGAMAASIFVLVGRSQNFYRIGTVISPFNHLRQLAFTISASLLFVTLFFFFVKSGSDHSRLVLVMFFGIAAPGVCGGRLLSGRILREGIKSGWANGKPAILIGEASEISSINPDKLVRFGIGEVARLELAGGDRPLSAPDKGKIQRALDLARATPGSEFALFMSWSSRAAIDELSGLFQELPISVKLYPDVVTREMWSRHRGSNFDPYIAVEMQREPLRRHERYAKRALDIIIATGALVLLAPILGIAAAWIKLDSSGPVIFRQRRRGFDQNTFVIFKFRTMNVLDDGAKIEQATNGDARITRFGRLLRKSSIDELPQLWNVIRGDMSLVGPRPHAVAHDVEYSAKIEQYARRHHVMPGLTGAAQIHGCRGETRTVTQMAERVKWDLWYINNWSLGLDVWIIFRTFISLLKHEVF